MINQTELSDFEKNIYNTFLKVSRKVHNQPYSIRKNFDDIDEHLYINIKKLAVFFQKFPNIDPEVFFYAPYKIYDDNRFNIEWYNTRKALVAYTSFKKTVENIDPDNESSIQEIKKSMIFISSFCKERNIPFKDYFKIKEGIFPKYLLDFKNENISFFIVLESPTYYSDCKEITSEEYMFLFSKVYGKIDFLKRKYASSKISKPFIQKFFQI